MNDAELAILAAELTTSTHPSTPTYNADNQLAADEINALNITRIRANMTGAEILQAADSTEYAALTDAAKNRFLTFTSGNETINPEAGGIAQQILVDIFGGGSTTITTLASLREETVSQATVLGIPGVSAGDVEHARGG